MATNKVVYGNTTLIDLTEDTLTASVLGSGYTAHDRSGTQIVGTAVTPDISNCYQTTDTAETTVDDADYFPFYDSSATAKKNSLWSNIKSVLAEAFLPVSTKNLTGYTLDNLKLSNSGGTWSGNSYTKNGMTFECAMSGITNTLSYIIVQGTATADVSFKSKVWLPSGYYKLSGCTGGSSSTYGITIEGLTDVNCYNGDTDFYVHSDSQYSIAIFYKSGYAQSSSRTFFPMIRPSYLKSNSYRNPVFSNSVLTQRMPRWVASATVSSGTITFSNVYDNGDAFEVYINITSSSTNKTPYAKLNTISGNYNARTFEYKTDADSGATAYLLRTPLVF